MELSTFGNICFLAVAWNEAAFATIYFLVEPFARIEYDYWVREFIVESVSLASSGFFKC